MATELMIWLLGWAAHAPGTARTRSLSSEQPYGLDDVRSSRRDEGIMLLAKITQLASRIRT